MSRDDKVRVLRKIYPKNTFIDCTDEEIDELYAEYVEYLNSNQYARSEHLRNFDSEKKA